MCIHLQSTPDAESRPRGGRLYEGRQGDNASLVAAGGAILALVTEGELIVFEAGGAAFKVLRRYTVAETPTWAHLAVVGDGILVKDTGSLAYLRF